MVDRKSGPFSMSRCYGEDASIVFSGQSEEMKTSYATETSPHTELVLILKLKRAYIIFVQYVRLNCVED